MKAEIADERRERLQRLNNEDDAGKSAGRVRREVEDRRKREEPATCWNGRGKRIEEGGDCWRL